MAEVHFVSGSLEEQLTSFYLGYGNIDIETFSENTWGVGIQMTTRKSSESPYGWFVDVKYIKPKDSDDVGMILLGGGFSF